MKNCGLRFHAKIAQKDFLSDLMKVVQQKVSSIDFLLNNLRPIIGPLLQGGL